MKQTAVISYSSSKSNQSIYDCKDGIVEIIYWRECKYFNLEMSSNKPIWEILKGKNLFDFMLGESVEIDIKTLNKFFISIKEK